MEQPQQNTLPYSAEAEKSVLGSMLLSREAVESACEVLKPEDFYIPAHQDIFDVMYSLNAKGDAVDAVTVTDSLARAGKLEQVGTVVYISELSLYTPSAANAAHYIRIVEERSIMRRLVQAGGRISHDGMTGEKPVEVMLDDAERAIFDISMKKSQDSLMHISSTVAESYERIGELMRLKGAITGVPTGFIELDRLTSGLQKSDLVILAGRPSMGKTAFALCIAEHAAIRAQKTICIFSLEMPRAQLVTRLLCAESQVNMQSIKTGIVSDAELLRIAETTDPLSRANIYIDDTGGIGVAEIRSKCRRLKTRAGLDMVIIDYLQLMQTSGRGDNRVTEIAEITRALKILAREMEVPIVLLSQLSRGPETRSEHRPMMSDLRESGAIEQDADLIMLLYREAVYDPDADNTTEIIVAKHRNGPTDTVKLMWLDTLAKFVNPTDRTE